LLVYLIYAFSAGIISAVVGGITGLISYFTTKDISTTIGVVTSVINIFSFLFYIVFYVSVCLHYFNLSERYDSSGLRRRLDTLGQTGNNFNDVQEQY
jgi:ABC-type dipeptide/oligopeptide/nickel transport system permease component